MIFIRDSKIESNFVRGFGLVRDYQIIKTDYKMNKSTVKEIRERFDRDVERFSNLDTGQVSTIDAALSLELITESAQRICPQATSLLDVGCGAGNYTIKMLQKIPNLNCTLLDLSRPMLDKAFERVSAETRGEVSLIQGNLQEIDLPAGHYHIILAGAVLHHLREDADWEFVFARLYDALSPGGCLMISDLIRQDSEALNDYFRERYRDYLTGTGGEEYQRNVFDYIEKEDSPRSVFYQLDLMRRVGFRKMEVLHKNVCFAAYGGIK